MYIIYCDDDIVQAKGFCQEYAELLKEHTLQGCTTPQFIFEEIEKGSNPDIVLMDIELGRENNGIEYARKLHLLSPKTRLILVTAYAEKFVQEAFFSKKHIAAFLTKPIQHESLLRALFDREENTQSRTFSFQFKGEIVSLAEEEIVYLESNKHYVLINTADGSVFTVQGKLSEYEKLLSDVFVKCIVPDPDRMRREGYNPYVLQYSLKRRGIKLEFAEEHTCPDNIEEILEEYQEFEDMLNHTAAGLNDMTDIHYHN